MSREKRRMKDMFDEFKELTIRVDMLKGIVQNEGIQICDEELMEWVDLVNGNINKLNSLKEDVVRFYQD